MLRVEIIGNLGSDPESRFMPSGTELLSFRVAVNSVRGKGDERKERTDWFRVKVAGGRAKYLSDVLRKGSRVLAVGRLEIDEYQDRDDNTRQSWDIWADDVVNLSPRDDGEPRAATAPQSREPAPAGRQQRSQDLEDLPF